MTGDRDHTLTVSAASVSGFEIALIVCLVTNTVINVSQSSGWWTHLMRRCRLHGSRLLTISKDQNVSLFYHISHLLHKHSKSLKHRTTISFTYGNKQRVFIVPDRNSEVCMDLPYGKVWIKVISLDDYNICAYEITCYSSCWETIDKFLGHMVNEFKDSFSKDDLHWFNELSDKSKGENVGNETPYYQADSC